MKLADFGLLTDENINPVIVHWPRTFGFNVFDVRQDLQLGMTDVELIRQAHAQVRVIVTHDRDFGTMAVAGGEPLTGILYLRPGHAKPEFVQESMETLLRQAVEVTPPFIIVVERVGTDVRIRLRQWT